MQQEVISKGSYTYPQRADLVSVKQYLILREGEQKYLLLRMSNDRDQTVTHLSFVLKQYDVKGSLLRRDTVSACELGGKAGSLFSLEDKFPLEERCVDFRVELLTVGFGSYTYVIRGSEAHLTYGQEPRKEEAIDRVGLVRGMQGKTRRVSHKTMRAPVLLLIVACAMILSLVFCTAIQLRNFMRTEILFTLDHVEYIFETDNKEDGPICILRYTGTAGNIVFPEEIEGYPVARIANSAFADSKLNSVTVEGQVIVEDFAFANSKYLRSVTLNRVTSLGDSVFENCKRLESVELGDRLERVGSYAFSSCGSLEQLTLPDTVRVLEKAAFVDCDSLESLSVPASAEEIGEDLVKGCDSLGSVSVPFVGQTVQDAAPLGYLFGDRNNTTVPRSLKSVTVTLSDTVCERCFVNCSSLEKILFENEVVSIGAYGFFGCSSLEAFAFTDSLEELGAYAFGSCSSLCEVVLPESLSVLEEAVFTDCVSLQTLTLPDTLERIGATAFGGCSALSEVTVPDSVTALDANAFLDCSALEQVTVPFIGSSAEDSESFASVFGGTATESLRAVTLTQESVVCAYAFADLTRLERVYLNDTVTEIGEGAFRGCIALREVALPAATQTLGAESFSGCMALTDLTLPQGIRELPSMVFSGCASLAELTVPNSVTAVGDSAFAGCISLSNLFWSESLETIGVSAFAGCASLKTVNLPGGVSTVSDSAFAGCGSLTAVMLSNAITHIGNDAFAGCESLTEIILPAKVESIGGGAFRGCDGLARAVVPESVTSMGAAVFENCSSLEELTLPFLGSSLEDSRSLGYFFTDDEENENLAVPLSLRQLTLIGGVSLTDGAFSGCSFLRDVELPASLTEIGVSAFRDCSSLQKLILPASLEELGAGAFFGCSALREIALPEGVQEIGVMTFQGCLSLTEVQIPSTVTRLGDNAFLGCLSLTEVELPVKYGLTLGNSVFTGCSALTKASLGKNVLSIGRGVFASCSALEELTVPYLGSSPEDAQTLDYFFDSVPKALRAVTVTGVADGVSLADGAFASYTGLETVVLSDLVTEIGAEILTGCSSVTSLTVPFLGEDVEDVQTVTYLFGNDTSVRLEQVTVTLATELADRAFYGCDRLRSVSLSENLRSIGAYAFYGCRQLKSFTVSEQVTFIGSDAFEGCHKLYEVYNLSDAGYSSYFDSAINVYSNTDVPSRVTTADGLVFILGLEDDAWYLVDFVGEETTVSLPESFVYEDATVTSYHLPSYLFYADTHVEILGLSSAVESIGEYLFYDSSALKRVTSGASWASLTAIPSAAFYSCSQLQSVTLPASVQTIADDAFQNCPKLYEVYNLTDLPIVAGETDYGYVAYHAYVVHSSPTAEALHEVSIDGVNFMKSDDLWYLISYTGEDRVLRLSSFVYNGKVVDSYIIDRDAFAGNTVLTELYVDGVATEIREGAFYNMPNLQTLSLAGNRAVSEMDSSFFSGCTSLKHLVLPDSLTELKDSSFEGLSGLQTLVMGDGIVSIGERAFYGCTGLETVEFSDSLGSIGAYAFYNCRSLRAVSLPDDVTSMGERVFSGCYSLQTVSLPGNLEVIPDYGFYGCSALRSVALPLSVQTVGDSAFRGCSSMTRVTLSDALKTVGSYAFADCSALSSVTLPDSLISLKEYAFCNSGLQTVTFGSGLTSISNSAFERCTSLQTLTLPSEITSVGERAFANCRSLKTLTAYGLETIGVNGFSQCSSLERISLPRTLVSIGESAFASCTALSFLSLPYGLTTLGQNAFCDCSSLRTLSIPGTVSVVGAYAFRNCTSLTGVTLAEGIQEIGSSAFQGCSSLQTLSLPNSVTAVGTYALEGCTSLASLSLGNNLATVGGYAFRNCTALRTLVIPSSVTTVGEYAFAGCTSLETLEIFGNITSMGNYAFADCTSLSSLLLDGGIRQIGNYAFQYCTALVSLSIPDSVTTIGSYAFRNCTALETVTMGTGVTTLNTGVFRYCTALRSVALSSNITSIGTYAFQNCQSLEEITWPTRLTTINSSAFANCSSLRRAMLPNGVRYVYAYAFQNCSELRTVRLPQTLRTISNSAFYGCHRLFEVFDLTSSITVTENSTAYGYVGYYAGKIHTSDTATRVVFETRIVDGVTYDFATVDGTTYLFAAEDYTTALLELPQLATSYTIHRYAIRRNISRVVLPTCVSEVVSGGNSRSSLANATVYYRGNATRWSNSPLSSAVSWGSVYYYIDCIHENGAGYWTYENGDIVTEVKLNISSSLKTPATCEEEGTWLKHCNKCGEEWIVSIPATGHEMHGTYKEIMEESTCLSRGTRGFYCTDCHKLLFTEELPLLDHQLNQDGVCAVCEKTAVAVKAFDASLPLVNDTSSPFSIDENGVITSTNKVAYSSSTLTVTATTDMTVSFSYRTSSESGCDKLIIRKNNEELVNCSGEIDSYTSMTVALRAGEELTFTYSKDGSVNEGNDCAYLKDLILVY